MSAREEPGGRRSPGILEAEVQAVVVAAGSGGVTAPETLSRVDGRLAFTTVATTLNRLVRRGTLRRLGGRPARYVAVTGPDGVSASASAQRMHRLLAATPDRAALLQLFVAGLDPDDEARLAKLVADADVPDPVEHPADGRRTL